MKFLALLILLTFSFANAANFKSAPECSGEVANPSFTCIRQFAGDDLDIRFYMTEFQTCKNGRITELDRSLLGMYVIELNNPDKMEVISEDQIKLNLSAERTFFPDRADDVTVLLPTQIKMKSSQNTFEISVSKETELDFEGAQPDQNHYKATMKKFDSSGRLVGSGPMICFVGF